MSTDKPSVLPNPADQDCGLARCRVLVADDDGPSLMLAGEAMRHFNCEVKSVANGQAALDAVRRERFDLVFLDIHMPQMDGFAVARAIRTLEAEYGTKRLPLVALTASAMPHEQSQCLAQGMDDVLLKPFRLEGLRRMLEKWCGRRHEGG